MSIKRTSSDRSSGFRSKDDSSAKIDRQELWDELSRRAEANEPFSPADVAQSMAAPEGVVAKSLLTLAFERFLERVDPGRYRSGVMRDASQADFNKALLAKIDPKRQQDQVEIERLKKNNDEMRRRLHEAVAERDRMKALLEKHGVDPSETP